MDLCPHAHWWLLGATGYYTHKMDTWGVGCVFFEVVSLFPLFPGALCVKVPTLAKSLPYKGCERVSLMPGADPGWSGGAGTNEIDQMDRIQSVLGPPPPALLDAYRGRSGYSAQVPLWAWPQFPSRRLCSTLPPVSAAAALYTNQGVGWDLKRIWRQQSSL